MVCIFSDGKGVIYIQKRRVERFYGFKGLRFYISTLRSLQLLYVLSFHTNSLILHKFAHFIQLKI